MGLLCSRNDHVCEIEVNKSDLKKKLWNFSKHTESLQLTKHYFKGTSFSAYHHSSTLKTNLHDQEKNQEYQKDSVNFFVN